MVMDNPIDFEGYFIREIGAGKLSWEYFVNIFVDEPKMAKRYKIFKEYNTYLEDLNIIVGECSYSQWIDGSFVTKKTNPNDIDLVTFLPEDIFFKVETKLSALTKPRVQILYNGLIDAYILPDTEANRNAWYFEFSRVKGRNKKPIPGKKKGFIELHIQGNNTNNEK
jgi:hypothetical protein